MNKQLKILLTLSIALTTSACSLVEKKQEQNITSTSTSTQQSTKATPVSPEDYPIITPAEVANKVSRFVDNNGNIAYIPAQFKVSEKQDEQKIDTGLVIIGPDDSEFVWIPTTTTPLKTREFGRYFTGGRELSDFNDETNLESYQNMVNSTEKYGGFYIGRYEASRNSEGLPASKRITENEQGSIFSLFSPQDATIASENVYSDNDTVQGFFPWGANWDTMLQWLIDSGDKTLDDIRTDSTNWGNYSNDTFSEGAVGNYTGAWEEAKSNNIYDLAGNNWEWTQERTRSSNYALRGGGYNLMGGACPGDLYPAALRNALPGNNLHPNVVFRLALYVKYS